MQFFKRFTTSEKITLTFWIFHLVSLFLFFLAINIGYFFSWYNEQKEESLRDMDKKYSLFSMPESDMEVEEFTNYLLEKETLIIPNNGKIICSPSLNEKIHDDIDTIKNAFIYRYNGKIYFIFSEYYDKVWLVKILFDTTAYINAQMIILKISLFFIILSTIFYIFIGKKLTKKSLKELTYMSEKARDISLEKSNTPFTIKWPAKDEIRILSETLNKMLGKIESQAKNLKQFTTDMSHEFKTPLMVMSSHIDLIEKKYTWKENTQFLTQLKKSIQHLNTLLETLLLIARFEEKWEEGQKIHITVKSYIESKKDDLYWLYKEKNIHFILTIPENLTYEVHESSFQIVVDNLLTNALKFSNIWGTIKIEATKKGFSVSDSWKWMNTEEQKNIFEKFYRADKSSTWFWIGLYLVKRIVDIHNWSIRVQSEPNKWTIFSVEF